MPERSDQIPSPDGERPERRSAPRDDRGRDARSQRAGDDRGRSSRDERAGDRGRDREDRPARRADAQPARRADGQRAYPPRSESGASRPQREGSGRPAGGGYDRAGSDRRGEGGDRREDGGRPAAAAGYSRGGSDRREGGDRRESGGRPAAAGGYSRAGGDRREGGGRPAGGGFSRGDGDRTPDRERRAPRPDRPDRPVEPEVAEDVMPSMLDRAARQRLRTLTKDNADGVARHLVMAGRLVDTDPELAYAHAQAAMRRAARVDVVREALALTAYATERYAEALRELRTVRRLSGVDVHRAIEADCERGLGRPERALAVIAEAPPAATPEDAVELAIVASGARADLGEHEAGLIVLENAGRTVKDPALRQRLDVVRADRLDELGRADEAAALRAAAGVDTSDEEEDEIIVTDLDEDEETIS